MHVPEGSVVEWVDRGPTGAGVLDGVSVAVKEIFEVSGCPRRTGTDLTLPGVPEHDAAAVARLRGAGARVVARSTSHEFAWGITNRRADGSGTENPLLPGRVSGGSTGGSAALVAAGVVDLGLGSDTAGSTRIPPAFCGTYGWKASNGVVSLEGCVPLAPRFDCAGLIARSAGLLRRGATALGIPVESEVPQPSPLRVGVLDPAVWRVADTERARVLDEVSQALGARATTALGEPASVFRTFSVLQAAEVLRAHRDLIGTWPRDAQRYPAFVRERLVAAESLAPDVANAAEADLQSLQHEAGRLWDEIDVLVTVLPYGPSTVVSPDTIDTPDGVRPLREVLVPWTCLANLLGSPAAVAPVLTDRTGAPIAVQLMSRPGSDALLLRCVDEWFGS